MTFSGCLINVTFGVLSQAMSLIRGIFKEHEKHKLGYEARGPDQLHKALMDQKHRNSHHNEPKPMRPARISLMKSRGLDPDTHENHFTKQVRPCRHINVTFMHGCLAHKCDICKSCQQALNLHKSECKSEI